MRTVRVLTLILVTAALLAYYVNIPTAGVYGAIATTVFWIGESMYERNTDVDE